MMVPMGSGVLLGATKELPMSDSARMLAAAVVAVVEEVVRPKTLRPTQSVATPTPAQRKQASNRKAAQVFAIVRKSTDDNQTEAATHTGDTQKTISNWECGRHDLGALRALVQLLERRAEQRAKGGK
jgi:hypothetical protein